MEQLRELLRVEQDNTRLAAGVFVRACASLDRHGRGSSDLVEDEMTTSEPVRKHPPHSACVYDTRLFVPLFRLACTLR